MSRDRSVGLRWVPFNARMKKKLFLQYALWLPPALWYRLIWGFSAQTAAVSGDMSDRLLYRFLLIFSPAFAASGEEARLQAVEILSFLERKAAHMFLYFMLALLLLAALSFWTGRKRALFTAFLLCAAAAVLDEYHQTFVPGRSGEIRDILVDLGGAFAALALAALLSLWRKNIRPARLVLGGLCFLPALLALLPLPIPGFSLLCQAAAPFAALLALPGGALLLGEAVGTAAAK